MGICGSKTGPGPDPQAAEKPVAAAAAASDSKSAEGKSDGGGFLYWIDYKMLDDCRDNCFTLFGSMTPEQDKADMGDSITLLGRWHDGASASGAGVCRAPSAKAVQNWLLNWASMCTCEVKPVQDDNTTRSIILKKDADFAFDYSHIGDEAAAGEHIFLCKFKFYTDKKEQAYKIFGGMTEAQDTGDAGKVRSLGRYHHMGTGSGYVVCAATSEVDIFKWIYNWVSMCEVTVQPVLTDSEARKIIRARPGHAAKSEALMKAMGMA